MAGPEDLGIDTAALGDVANQTNRLKLLELLQLQAQGKRNAKTSMLGDVLKLGTESRKDQADSYAPGTKYEAGWEPGGLMDSILAMGNGPSTGYASMSPDDPQRLISRVDLEDPETLVTNALGIINRITGADEEDNPVQKALMDALVQSLVPQSKAEGKPSTGTLSGRTGDTDMGVGGTATTPANSIKPPLGKAGEPKSQGGGGRRTLAGDAGSVLDALTSGYGDYRDVVNNGLAGITDYLGLTSPKGGGAPKVTAQNVNGDATAALVAQIMQRAGGATKKGGANTPGSKHPTGYKDGSQVFEGPTMIRVGERSPKDKKYATEEVVYAAPGTVVAPVPKGMENPSHEDAMGLILAQVLKTKGKMPMHEEMHDSALGSMTSSASTGRAGASNMAQFRATSRQRNSEFNRDFGLRERSYFTQRDQGNRSLDLTDQGQRMNYDLGLRNWQQSGQLGNRRLDIDQELGRGNLDLGRRNLEINFQRNQEEFRNWEAERALKRELGMRGLDIDQQRANQDYALNSAQMAFQQIMAGITGSSLPGVRAGRTPQLSLLG